MNKKSITIGLIFGKAMSNCIEFIYPEPSVGISSMKVGTTSLALASHVLRQSSKSNIDKIILKNLGSRTFNNE